MKKQVKKRLTESSKFILGELILLMITFLVSCQKEIPDSIEHMNSSTITFQKTYGGPNDEYIGNVQPTNDSGYIIIGATRSYGAGDGDIYVVKVNAQGSVQWTKTYGALYWEAGEKIKQTKDGGYILGGAGDGYENYILMKTDAEGNIQWSKSYGYFGEGNSYDVQLTDDGGYIIMSQAYHSTIGVPGVGGAFCIKTDENGNVLWHKKYSGGGGVSIVKTIDGGYVILGDAGSGYGLSRSTQLTKIDANGNVLWSKGSGSLGGEYPLSMKTTTDGGFIITGMTSINYGTNNYDAYVLKTDASGNQIWFKTYGGATFDGAYEIEETTDKGYIFSGITGNFREGHVLVIKTDNSGNLTWSKIFDGGKAPFAYVHQAKDGGFIIASQTAPSGTGSSDFYLIKTDNNGNAGCYENSFSLNVSTIATPPQTNPFVDISTGLICFDLVLKTGIGGVENKLCYK